MFFRNVTLLLWICLGTAVGCEDKISTQDLRDSSRLIGSTDSAAIDAYILD